MQEQLEPTLAQCRFYHSLDLPTGTVAGDWDLRGRFQEYIGHVPIAGRSVLDVGTASGFLTFEAEKSGADSVTSFDSDSAANWQIAPDETMDHEYYRGMRNSYRFAHKAFGSSATCVLGNVYSVNASVPVHDVVLVAQILVHLRDPLAAIEAAASRARELLVITEGMANSEEAVAHYLGGRTRYAWWHLSRGIYRQWLDKLGFDITSHDSAEYRCNATDSSHPVATLVATRR